MVDDLVDEPNGWSRGAIRAQLDDWQRWLAQSPVPPNGSALTNALADAVNRRGIPQRHLVELVEGCKSDLFQPRFEEFYELRRYCYQVGATVGLALCPILGLHDARGLDCARDLGIAMQLTNVIRDVPEDLAMGRRYLPAREVRAFGCDAHELRRGGDFAGLIRFQCDRARDYYRAGREGICWVQPAARFAIRLAAALYEAILDKIAQQDYDVYARRAATSLREKVWLAVRLKLTS